MSFGRVPSSITFGFKVLQIPSLEEVGIPLGGLGYAKSVEGLQSQKYSPNPQACWVDRGTALLTYRFVFYPSEKPNKLVAMFREEQKWHQEFTITSPISGILLQTREEDTVAVTNGLLYPFNTDRTLPVFLVPNDEPAADTSNFYTYDQIARLLASNMDLLPTRHRSETSSERLRDFLRRPEAATEEFEEARRTLNNRNHDKYRSVVTRELSPQDHEIIRNIQDLRSKDISLRDKLVHIARKFGESA